MFESFGNNLNYTIILPYFLSFLISTLVVGVINKIKVNKIIIKHQTDIDIKNIQFQSSQIIRIIICVGGCCISLVIINYLGNNLFGLIKNTILTGGIAGSLFGTYLTSKFKINQ